MSILVGQWRLSAWRRIAGDGTVTYPFGEDATGLLIYTADGHMAVQMTAAGRPKLDTTDPRGGGTEERAAAYSTSLAYVGRYEVNGGEVTHRLGGCSFPNWSDTVQVRPFTCDGGRLVLRTPPSQIDGITVVNEMAWIWDGPPRDLTHHPAAADSAPRSAPSSLPPDPTSSGDRPMTQSQTQPARARAAAHTAVLDKHPPRAAHQQTDLASLARYMFLLMLRNVTSDGYVIEDPTRPGQFSLPGCVVAAPSYPANTPGVDQDYVFNWVRDAAITALELVEGDLPESPDGSIEALNDYVLFAQTCQNNATPTLAHACFTVDGQSRPWTEQSDGPAVQTIALLRAYSQLSGSSQVIAKQVIARNLEFLLGNYQNPTTNLWEEHQGLSFFARAVQLRCFREVAANTLGIPVPQGTADAANWLERALENHWNGQCYVTLLASDSSPGVSAVAGNLNYDPNIDIVCASVYGAVPVTDTKLLATAAALRGQWADDGSAWQYPINADDRARGIGPLLGRYPGDIYDGDVSDPVQGGHPWALCTANLAELYYRLAAEIESTQAVPLDDLSRPFFAQVGITDPQPPAQVAEALRGAGDAMLRAVVFHSDHYELSEQFDSRSGYEKSVRNLTWSYAAFLSAVRARTPQQPVKTALRKTAKARRPEGV